MAMSAASIADARAVNTESRSGLDRRFVGANARLTVLASVRMTIKARVEAGRLVIDEPTNLPEGTQIELLPLDPGGWLDDADRAPLHAALAASNSDVAPGRLVDAADILREL
jgi:hypothetical protein